MSTELRDVDVTEVRGVVPKWTPVNGFTFEQDVTSWMEDEGASPCEEWRDEKTGKSFKLVASSVYRSQDPEQYREWCERAGFSQEDADHGFAVLLFRGTNSELRFWMLRDESRRPIARRFVRRSVT